MPCTAPCWPARSSLRTSAEGPEDLRNLQNVTHTWAQVPHGGVLVVSTGGRWSAKPHFCMDALKSPSPVLVVQQGPLTRWWFLSFSGPSQVLDGTVGACWWEWTSGPDSEVYVATPTFLACGLLHQVQAGVGFPEAWWFFRVSRRLQAHWLQSLCLVLCGCNPNLCVGS